MVGMKGATLANTEFDFANPITSDVTLYANWLDVNADKYTVSFDANGGELGENTDNQNIIENGKAIQPTNNPSRKGYTFDGWYKGIDAEHLEDNAFVFTTAITSNVTLYAKWTAKTYTITLDSSVQDIDSKETTATYDSSSLTSFEAHTRVGYTLDGYYLEGLQTKLINTNGTLVASINEYTNSDSKWIKDSAVTLYAKWTAIEYTIVFDENGGTGSMNSIENVKIGDALSITNRFTAPDGKEFDGWSLTSDGAVLTDTTLSLTMIAEADENTNEIKLFAIWKDETTQATYSYTLVTNISQLSTGSLIVIVHNGSKAMSTNQKSNNRGETSFDASSTTMQDNVQYITLIANGANWNLQVGENQYLNATTATSNYLRTGTTTSGVGLWSISVTSTGVATITAQDGERNLMRYNSSSKIFSCYASGQQDIQIYLVTIS